MAKNYVQDGNTIEFVATADVLAGAPVAVGKLIAVAHGNVKTGEIGVGHTTGVFSLPKASGAITQGAEVYLLDGSITTTASGAVLAGKAWADAASADAEVLVKINI